MVERALIGGLLAALTGLGTFNTARAEDAFQPSPSSVILNLSNRPAESSEKAMTEAIREGALAQSQPPLKTGRFSRTAPCATRAPVWEWWSGTCVRPATWSTRPRSPRTSRRRPASSAAADSPEDPFHAVQAQHPRIYASGDRDSSV